MSVEDEQAPEATQETPESAPEQDSGTRAEEPQPDTNWEERYQNLQPQFTRTTQRLSELELALKGDPQHAHLLEEYGLQWAEPDDTDLDDEDEDDPIAPLSREVEELREWRQQQEENADLAAFAADVDRLADGTKLSQEDREFILNRSVAHGWNSEATERAFKEWQDWREQIRKDAIAEYGKSKKAPFVSKVGQGATDAPDLDSMSASDRAKFLAEKWAASQAE